MEEARQVSKSELSLVIFDCDGVLVDSEPIACRLCVEMFAELGIEMTFEQVVEKFCGLSRQSGMKILHALLGGPLPQEFYEQYDRRLFAALERDLKPVPGIPAALDMLTLPVCVASSGDHAKINKSLGITQLQERFAGKTFSAMDVERGKPHPDLFLHAAESMGVSPADCLVVEDTVPGVTAGVAAGMTVCGYTGTFPEDRLANAGAHFILSDMSLLPELLRNLSSFLRG